MNTWTLELLFNQSVCEEYVNACCENIISQTDEQNTTTFAFIHNMIGTCIQFPEGIWNKIEEISNIEHYKEFCNKAKDMIKQYPQYKYRVVKNIEEYGVNKSIVNDGVLKYLMATLDEKEII